VVLAIKNLDENNRGDEDQSERRETEERYYHGRNVS
jgi:hypothetical protein